MGELELRKYNVIFNGDEREFKDLASVVSFVISHLEEISLLCLYGELGIGKTFFTQHLLKGLGVQKNVTSPTFVIMNEYQVKYKSFNRTVRHIDVYRINAEQFLEIVPHDELIDDRFLYIIEWPENIDEVLPQEKRMEVYIASELGRR